MLREIVALMPDALLRCPPVAAVGCTALGAVIWAVGGRFSRSILSLVAVTAGAAIGMRMPAWCGWQIDGMGLAVAGAILLGACTFLLHRAAIGLLLGGVMMLWAGMATWLAIAGDVYWNWHGVKFKGDLVQVMHEAWQALPPPISKIFPVACFLGLAAGIAIAVYLPRLARVLVHSMTGVTLMAGMGSIAALALRPKWFDAIPAGYNLTFAGLLIGLTVAGAVIQWRIMSQIRVRVSARAAGGGGDAGAAARAKSGATTSRRAA